MKLTREGGINEILETWSVASSIVNINKFFLLNANLTTSTNIKTYSSSKTYALIINNYYSTDYTNTRKTFAMEF